MYRPKKKSPQRLPSQITAGKLGDVWLSEMRQRLIFSVKGFRKRNCQHGELNASARSILHSNADNANLGYSRIDLSTSSGCPEAAFSPVFRSEFRRPEFAVKRERIGTPICQRIGECFVTDAIAGGWQCRGQLHVPQRRQIQPPNRDIYSVIGFRVALSENYGNRRRNFQSLTDAAASTFERLFRVGQSAARMRFGFCRRA